jgi:hypothetical protein
MKSITGPASRSLMCHSRTPSRAIRGIDAVAVSAPDGSLGLAFTLEGDLSALCIPGSRSSRRAHELWKHTCFEAFVMADEGPGYREFNFSPSGEWAAYAFHGYREGGILEVGTGPGVTVRRTGDRLLLDADIRRELLPPGDSLRLGLATLVEDIDGMLSFWALRHAPGKPDFHHADTFALQLELTGMRDLNNFSGGAGT